ncbi:MAG: PLP-dependent aminotransferase family protein [Thermoplasmata archaeon]|nr:MAG: PLP-dependent aminotransferase family protein [Thermoplasmata archaeon]
MAQVDVSSVVSGPVANQLEKFFAVRVQSMHASEIRELLKLTQQPEIISFAGGLPNPEAFPVEEIRKITDEILQSQGKQALQYGTTEGLPRMREEIAKWVTRLGIESTVDNNIVVQGSQQGLDIVSKMFLDPGDNIIVGSPTYVGGSNAFEAYQGVMHQVEVDEDGMNMDKLEDKLKELNKKDIHPKFAYVVPTFQNPSGALMPEDRRKRMIELSNEYNFLIIEDSPYGEIQFEGGPIKPIKAYDDGGRVLYLGTFSKILSPGLRLAYIIADENIINKMIIAKQAVDLCSNTLAQYIGAEALTRGILKPHIDKIRALYKHKWELMRKGLNEHFPKEHVKWVEAKGGMFTWVTVPDYLDSSDLLKVAIEQHKVAYVIGAAFYPDRSVKNTMRVSFSYPTDEQIEIGTERLGTVIKDAIKE